MKCPHYDCIGIEIPEGQNKCPHCGQAKMPLRLEIYENTESESRRITRFFRGENPELFLKISLLGATYPNTNLYLSSDHDWLHPSIDEITKETKEIKLLYKPEKLPPQASDPLLDARKFTAVITAKDNRNNLLGTAKLDIYPDPEIIFNGISSDGEMKLYLNGRSIDTCLDFKASSKLKHLELQSTSSIYKD